MHTTSRINGSSLGSLLVSWDREDWSRVTRERHDAVQINYKTPGRKQQEGGREQGA